MTVKDDSAPGLEDHRQVLLQDTATRCDAEPFSGEALVEYITPAPAVISPANGYVAPAPAATYAPHRAASTAWRATSWDWLDRNPTIAAPVSECAEPVPSGTHGDKGFESFTPDDGGTDVFIHGTQLIEAEALQQGDTVSFDTEYNDRKFKYRFNFPRGANGFVTGVEADELVTCEEPHFENAARSGTARITYGTNESAECNSGHANFSCGANGFVTGSAACEPVTCEEPHFENATRSGTGSITYGTNETAECNTGHCTVEQIVDVPGPQFHEDIVEVTAVCSAGVARSNTGSVKKWFQEKGLRFHHP